MSIIYYIQPCFAAYTARVNTWLNIVG